MSQLRQHISLLLTVATIPLAIALALLVAQVGVAQTPLQRCAYLIEGRSAGAAGNTDKASRHAYQRCLANPVGFVR